MLDPVLAAYELLKAHMLYYTDNSDVKQLCQDYVNHVCTAEEEAEHRRARSVGRRDAGGDSADLQRIGEKLGAAYRVIQETQEVLPVPQLTSFGEFVDVFSRHVSNSCRGNDVRVSGRYCINAVHYFYRCPKPVAHECVNQLMQCGVLAPLQTAAASPTAPREKSAAPHPNQDGSPPAPPPKEAVRDAFDVYYTLGVVSGPWEEKSFCVKEAYLPRFVSIFSPRNEDEGGSEVLYQSFSPDIFTDYQVCRGVTGAIHVAVTTLAGHWGRATDILAAETVVTRFNGFASSTGFLMHSNFPAIKQKPGEAKPIVVPMSHVYFTIGFPRAMVDSSIKHITRTRPRTCDAQIRVPRDVAARRSLPQQSAEPAEADWWGHRTARAISRDESRTIVLRCSASIPTANIPPHNQCRREAANLPPA